MSQIEIAPFDDLLVYKKGYDIDKVAKIIKEKKLGDLRIFSILPSERIETIDFLKDYNFLERLAVTTNFDYDFSFLKNLPQLKKLYINSTGTNEVDLSSQVNLEQLSINWRKTIKGLENCVRLSDLCLVEFKEKNLERIEVLKSLTRLIIKTSSIASLSGIEELNNIQHILLANCKKLNSIAALNHKKTLIELELNTCTAIEDYRSLTDLPNLVSLNMVDCGNIPSIAFINNFARLENFSSLGRTAISDGDLIPAKRVKNVKLRHHKYYNLKIENPEFDGLIKENLNLIKRWFK